MSVIGEATLSAFLELLSGKLIDSVLNFVADHRKVHQQLEQWQSILPEIKAVLNRAEEKQIKDEDGVRNFQGKETGLQPAVEYVGRANEKQEMVELLKINNSDGVCVLSIVGMGGMGKTTLAQLVYNVPSIKESSDHRAWSITFEPCAYNDLNLLQVKLKEKLSGKSSFTWNSIGRLLRTVKDHSEWEKIYESEIWNLPEDPCGIIPPLRLSYHYLPPHLKRCFAYCSIFPRGYEFKKEEIILLWRAEGFLQPKAKSQAKGLGNQYFKDLVSRSFFQISSKDKSRFVMRDLMNDLAQLVEGEMCCRLEGEKQQKFSHRSHHAAYVSDDPYHIVKKSEAFYQMTSLRPFLPLPLMVPRCVLKNLPLKIGNLISLHCLNLRGADSIERMPSGFDQLTKLETLSSFVIGKGDGHLIRELKSLSNLGGTFRLSGLENVNGRDAREAKLNEKPGIDGLELHWSTNLENYTRKKEVEKWVLDFLCPQKKLEQHIIENYGGAKFASWIDDSSFKNLLSLKLRSCKNCKSLPSVGRLLLLKYLSIIGFHEVQKIGVEFFAENELKPFASLEILSFESLLNWKEWDACEGDENVLKFPILRELSIKLKIRTYTSLVVSISSFPSLCGLRIEGCAELVDVCSSCKGADRTMLRFGNLGYFEIGGWKELESLSQHGLSLVGHRSIDVSFCPQLHSLETEEAELQPNKVSLVESLWIRGCESLNRLPKVLHKLTFLTVMSISGCPGLVSSAENNLPPNLKKLHISGCENLEYLVDEKEDNKSMNSTLCVFEDLNISHCRSLMSFSSKGHKNICNQLQLLRTCDCSKLSCLFSNTKLPTTLKCPELECIAQEFDETACLESILIECSGIKSLPRGLDKLIHLQEIRLRECSTLVSIEERELLKVTTNLRAFSVDGCGNFGALPKGGGCSNVVSFPEEGIGMMLPPSLTSIRLSNFENLEFIFSEGFQGLSTLRNLFIYSCPKLTYLPEKDMLLSLGYLYILFCPLLKEECSSDKGREWSKISHITRAQIDFKSVIPRESD
ncbi:hypothetical protein GOBAR_DD19840 [Gossypium barbadense]|nr:hypothetical protein GOBAR_DD19840 [Gossypium barbadense]